MADKDLKELRQLLREAVDASRMHVRDVESAIGVGHGNLDRLLNGSCASATCSPSPVC